MNRRVADRLVVLLVAVVLLGGLYGSWQAYQQRQSVNRMMGSMMGGAYGVNPLWYVLGTIVAAVVVGGVYVAVRDDLTTTAGTAKPAAGTLPVGGTATPEDTPVLSDTTAQQDPTELKARSRRRVLDLLHDDEWRVREPVLASPGITQIELRDRSAFSKSKVSQTVTALEKRGLLHRERQGRTYRVYPDDALVEADTAGA